MHYFDLNSLYPDAVAVAAWDTQITEAVQMPWLQEMLRGRGNELLPRFAACHAELRALPRDARRALQRRVARSSEFTAMFSHRLHAGGARAVQRKLARSLAGAALLLALAQGVATADSITVTTNDSRVRQDGQCSLIEAIVNANIDAATHSDCVAGSGADTIVLPVNAKVKLRAVHDKTYGATGLPTITTPITIEGNNATIFRQGNPAFRLIAVGSSGDLTLQNVTLKGGASLAGGGVFNNGTVTLENSIISGNKATSTNQYAFGGGVYNKGTLTVQNSTISRNTVAGRSGFYGSSGGGGAFNSGTLTIENSAVSGNTASGVGGGVLNLSSYNAPTNITIINSTISRNTACGGGGVSNSAYYGLSSAAISNSTISGNGATCSGGGISNFSYGYSASMTITNSTISGNTADHNGGGILNTYSSVLTLSRSLVSGNKAAAGAGISNSGALVADNHNLFGSNGKAAVTGFTPGLTDIVPAPGVTAAKILDRLKANGGPTQTHALKPGSPALDVLVFTDPDCAGTDQRGVARPQGTGCDIGAFERDGP
jgi:hypothetical protein